jgi:hypothetical protein
MSEMTTSNEFWIARMSEVLEKAAGAPSERSRNAYLELARHYCSMHQLLHGTRRSARLERLNTNGSVAEAAGHSFGSVHDVLQAA